jgi:hypothetical protein
LEASSGSYTSAEALNTEPEAEGEVEAEAGLSSAVERGRMSLEGKGTWASEKTVVDEEAVGVQNEPHQTENGKDRVVQS